MSDRCDQYLAKYLGSDSKLAPARPALYSLSDVVGTIAHPVARCFPGRLLSVRHFHHDGAGS